MPNKIKVLFIGDVVGSPGRSGVRHLVPEIVESYGIDLVIANGENAAGGIGITPQVADELLRNGVHVLTSGNHVWAKKEILGYLSGSERILRPANYPPGLPGRGGTVIHTRGGDPIGVFNLQGRVYMDNLDCPFRVAEKEIETLKKEAKVVILDFHAEATSEKVALGWFLDGRISAVLGTHTHIQTADERILPHGTAYITDVGMTGSVDSVIGMKKEIAIERFLTQVPRKLEVAKRDIQLQGVVLEIDKESGGCVRIKRVQAWLEKESTRD
ncbi:MAG TPA: TIGR00282 family metallophosphoesterase [Proteobacteria bacterium]|jgi:metallophosphoesterase (TIGR00282 family)|nr:TIGR00282 family metallophosphoesterase [Pseudomonadota bacterium]